MYGIRRRPPGWRQAAKAFIIALSLLYHGELPTRLDSLHGQCDPIFPLNRDEQHSISVNSAIYLRIYCRAKYFAREFILGQRAFRFSRKVAPENFWHFIELWNEINSITEPTTSTQARTRIARMGVGTLNQSTSRDCFVMNLWAHIFHSRWLPVIGTRRFYLTRHFFLSWWYHSFRPFKMHPNKKVSSSFQLFHRRSNFSAFVPSFTKLTGNRK